jgi:hypothetical protein
VHLFLIIEKGGGCIPRCLTDDDLSERTNQKSTVHAAAMYWAYLFPQLEKIIFPVRKKIFLGIKKACG